MQAQKELFEEVIEMTVIPLRYRGTAPPNNACRKALLVVSAWAKAAEMHPGGAFKNTAATKDLHGEIGKVAAAKPKDLDAELVKLLLARKLHEHETFDDDALRAEIDTLGGIDFPTWVRIVVRLRELFLGYELI